MHLSPKDAPLPQELQGDSPMTPRVSTSGNADPLKMPE